MVDPLLCSRVVLLGQAVELLIQDHRRVLGQRFSEGVLRFSAFSRMWIVPISIAPHVVQAELPVRCPLIIPTKSCTLWCLKISQRLV